MKSHAVGKPKKKMPRWPRHLRRASAARNVDLTDPDGWMECSENGDTATVSDAPGRPK